MLTSGSRKQKLTEIIYTRNIKIDTLYVHTHLLEYFSKWTKAFPIKDKCADTVADVLVDKIILRFRMPLVIHSDQGKEFENGLMKSLCNLLGCVKTHTAPYHPESDGMVERFNQTCLMMLSMFVNDQRDNWHKLLPFVMHAYQHKRPRIYRVLPLPSYDGRRVCTPPGYHYR